MNDNQSTKGYIIIASSKLGWTDYIVILVGLICPLLLGIYYGIIQGKKNITSAAYFFGDRKLGFIPITFSLLATFLSAILTLGSPGEVYSFSGIMMAYEGVGICLAVFLAAFTFQPFLCKLGISTTFEVLSFLLIKMFNLKNIQFS